VKSDFRTGVIFKMAAKMAAGNWKWLYLTNLSAERRFWCKG